MPNTLGNIYLFIIFADVAYLFVLLYGGMWYTKKVTVECPNCGLRISKYNIETHQCPPELMGDDDATSWSPIRR